MDFPAIRRIPEGLTRIGGVYVEPTLPWEIEKAVHDSKSLDVSGKDTAVVDVELSTDGGSIYLLGDTTDMIYQYLLCDPWDLGTAQYEGLLDVSGQTTSPTSIKFFQSGTVLWVADVAGIIYVYELSTAWDLSTAVYNVAANSTVAAQTTDVQGLTFANSEGLLFAVDGSGDVYRYTATYNDPDTTLGSSSTVDFATTTDDSTGIQMHGEGKKLFIADATDNKIHIFNLYHTYSLTDSASDSLSLDISSEITTLAGFVISADGFSLYAIDGNDSKIYSYSME